VLKKTLGKKLFAECYIFDTRQISSLPNVKKSTRQRNSLPSVKNKTLGKSFFAECRKKYSAKHLAFGKEPNSGSEMSKLVEIT
jgi:hypothetical protein